MSASRIGDAAHRFFPSSKEGVTEKKRSGTQGASSKPPELKSNLGAIARKLTGVGPANPSQTREKRSSTLLEQPSEIRGEKPTLLGAGNQIGAENPSLPRRGTIIASVNRALRSKTEGSGRKRSYESLNTSALASGNLEPQERSRAATDVAGGSRSFKEKLNAKSSQLASSSKKGLLQLRKRAASAPAAIGETTGRITQDLKTQAAKARQKLTPIGLRKRAASVSGESLGEVNSASSAVSMQTPEKVLQPPNPKIQAFLDQRRGQLEQFLEKIVGSDYQTNVGNLFQDKPEELSLANPQQMDQLKTYQAIIDCLDEWDIQDRLIQHWDPTSRTETSVPGEKVLGLIKDQISQQLDVLRDASSGVISTRSSEKRQEIITEAADAFSQLSQLLEGKTTPNNDPVPKVVDILKKSGVDTLLPSANYTLADLLLSVVLKNKSTEIQASLKDELKTRGFTQPDSLNQVAKFFQQAALGNDGTEGLAPFFKLPESYLKTLSTPDSSS